MWKGKRATRTTATAEPSTRWDGRPLLHGIDAAVGAGWPLQCLHVGPSRPRRFVFPITKPRCRRSSPRPDTRRLHHELFRLRHVLGQAQRLSRRGFSFTGGGGGGGGAASPKREQGLIQWSSGKSCCGSAPFRWLVVGDDQRRRDARAGACASLLESAREAGGGGSDSFASCIRSDLPLPPPLHCSGQLKLMNDKSRPHRSRPRSSPRPGVARVPRRNDAPSKSRSSSPNRGGAWGACVTPA